MAHFEFIRTSTASNLVETLRIIGDKPQGLLMFDRELAKR